MTSGDVFGEPAYVISDRAVESRFIYPHHLTLSLAFQGYYVIQTNTHDIHQKEKKQYIH